MAKSKTVKTAKPSGLSISKSGNKFSCSWKIPKEGFGDGQQFWQTTDDRVISIGKTTTSKSFTVNFGLYYPHTQFLLPGVEFGIRGNRDKKKDETDKWTWSDWVYKTYNLHKPPKPTITVEPQAARTAKFSWSVSPAENQPFADIVVQTVLTQNGASPNWNGATTWTTGSSGSWNTPEAGSVDVAGSSYTRWFRVSSRGAAGQSDWAYASHTYAHPKQAAIKSINVKENNASGYDVRVEWEALSNSAWPIDLTTVQYCIAQPGANASFNTGTWVDANESHDTPGRDAAFFTVDARCSADQCLFVRVNTKHDNNTTQGIATRAFAGKLKDPQLGTVTPDPTDYTVDIASVNKSDVVDSFQVIYYKSGAQGENPIAIGVIAHNSSSAANVQCPDWSNDEDGEVFFGVRAVVGTATYKTRADGVNVYEIKSLMASDIAWSDGVNVLQVTGLALSKTEVEGSIRAVWNWTWAAANCAEISWADHEDAWESTAAPSTFLIENKKASAWNIANLALGKIWYVRVRLLKKNDEQEIYTPYSDIVSIDLSSAPDRPQLDLSETVVAQGKDFTASWDYITTDGTLQESAELAEFASYAATAPAQKLGQYKAEQHADLNSDIWDTTGVKYLAVRVKSESGLISPWSDKVAITVATPLTATISETSLETVAVPSDDEEQTTRDQLSLTEMPLSVTVTGAGAGDSTTVYIKRADDYHVDRPDDSSLDGYEGETIAIQGRVGAGEVVIRNEDLIGSFDDGAKYVIATIVQDSLGQRDEAELEFEVHWSHQACEITAEALIDQGDMIAVISVPEPTGAEETDSFDLYRLSADKPELIIKGGAFDTKYVDPYPAIGYLGGHRVVSKTANGDYITADNVVEFYDIGEEDGDTLHAAIAIIDFGGDKVELKHGLTITSKWEKDFKMTKYLGGSVEGDWNEAIVRTGSLASTVIPTYEKDTLEAMRRLSTYSGICHVRTPEGSSYPADVQVASETWDEKYAGQAVTFSLSITRIDSQTMDGMTYEEWENGGA